DNYATTKIVLAIWSIAFSRLIEHMGDTEPKNINTLIAIYLNWGIKIQKKCRSKELIKFKAAEEALTSIMVNNMANHKKEVLEFTNELIEDQIENNLFEKKSTKKESKRGYKRSRRGSSSKKKALNENQEKEVYEVIEAFLKFFQKDEPNNQELDESNNQELDESNNQELDEPNNQELDESNNQELNSID
ncbi:12359_t:CDS:2, partial [Gigaspora margarita]